MIVVCPLWFVKCSPYIFISFTSFKLSGGVCLLFSGHMFMMLVLVMLILLPLASPKSSNFCIILLMEPYFVVSIIVSSAKALPFCFPPPGIFIPFISHNNMWLLRWGIGGWGVRNMTSLISLVYI